MRNLAFALLYGFPVGAGFAWLAVALVGLPATAALAALPAMAALAGMTDFLYGTEVAAGLAVAALVLALRLLGLWQRRQRLRRYETHCFALMRSGVAVEALPPAPLLPDARRESFAQMLRTLPFGAGWVLVLALAPLAAIALLVLLAETGLDLALADRLAGDELAGGGTVVGVLLIVAIVAASVVWMRLLGRLIRPGQEPAVAAPPASVAIGLAWPGQAVVAAAAGYAMWGLLTGVWWSVSAPVSTPMSASVSAPASPAPASPAPANPAPASPAQDKVVADLLQGPTDFSYLRFGQRPGAQSGPQSGAQPGSTAPSTATSSTATSSTTTSSTTTSSTTTSSTTTPATTAPATAPPAPAATPAPARATEPTPQARSLAGRYTLRGTLTPKDAGLGEATLGLETLVLEAVGEDRLLARIEGRLEQRGRLSGYAEGRAGTETIVAMGQSFTRRTLRLEAPQEGGRLMLVPEGGGAAIPLRLVLSAHDWRRELGGWIGLSISGRDGQVQQFSGWVELSQQK